jgi:hypothetical protein
MTTFKTALIAAAAVAIGAAFASTAASANTLLSTHLQATLGASPRLPAQPGTRIITPGVPGAPGSSAPSYASGSSPPPRIPCGFQDYECSNRR